MDVGSTIPRMESVESSLEQRPRATHMYRMYGIRVTQVAVTEEQSPKNPSVHFYYFYLKASTLSLKNGV